MNDRFNSRAEQKAEEAKKAAEAAAKKVETKKVVEQALDEVFGEQDEYLQDVLKVILTEILIREQTIQEYDDDVNYTDTIYEDLRENLAKFTNGVTLGGTILKVFLENIDDISSTEKLGKLVDKLVKVIKNDNLSEEQQDKLQNYFAYVLSIVEDVLERYKQIGGYETVLSHDSYIESHEWDWQTETFNCNGKENYKKCKTYSDQQDSDHLEYEKEGFCKGSKGILIRLFSKLEKYFGITPDDIRTLRKRFSKGLGLREEALGEKKQPGNSPKEEAPKEAPPVDSINQTD